MITIPANLEKPFFILTSFIFRQCTVVLATNKYAKSESTEWITATITHMRQKASTCTSWTRNKYDKNDNHLPGVNIVKTAMLDICPINGI